MLLFLAARRAGSPTNGSLRAGMRPAVSLPALTQAPNKSKWNRRFSVLAIFLATLLFKTAPADTNEYLSVARTRTYWFIADWHWYEQFGLLAPLAILAVIGLQRRHTNAAVSGLALATTIAGTVATVVAILFARTNSPTYLIARLQPLRLFQLVYILMILTIRGVPRRQVAAKKNTTLDSQLRSTRNHHAVRRTYTFPNSAHFEAPGREPINSWERAFEWIRVSTPVDALFALDANYVTQPGEDAQTFRAIAERSAVADYSKDGGEASITPTLTALWFTGQVAQTGLNTTTDARRIATLRPLGVSWIVLPSEAVTDFACSYADKVVKVCRLPQQH